MNISRHYEKVRQIMRHFGQAVMDRPGIPDEKTRLLRARLSIEEVLEKVQDGMAVDVILKDTERSVKIKFENLIFDIAPDRKPDLPLWMDGCADVSVVNTGDMISCGVPDLALVDLIDDNNLTKMGGPVVDGKFQKPPGYKPPDVKGLLDKLTKDADRRLTNLSLQNSIEEFGSGLIPPADTGIILDESDADDFLTRRQSEAATYDPTQPDCEACQ